MIYSFETNPLNGDNILSQSKQREYAAYYYCKLTEERLMLHIFEVTERNMNIAVLLGKNKLYVDSVVIVTIHLLCSWRFIVYQSVTELLHPLQ